MVYLSGFVLCDLVDRVFLALLALAISLSGLGLPLRIPLVVRQGMRNPAETYDVDLWGHYHQHAHTGNGTDRVYSPCCRRCPMNCGCRRDLKSGEAADP